MIATVTYTITDKPIKLFNSTKYLTTNPTVEFYLQMISFLPHQDLFNSLFDTETVKVDKIRLTDTFKTCLSCVKCAKQITDITARNASLMKCPTCNVVQTVSCATQGPVQNSTRRDQDQALTLLKVFTPSLHTMYFLNLFSHFPIRN